MVPKGEQGEDRRPCGLTDAAPGEGKRAARGEEMLLRRSRYPRYGCKMRFIPLRYAIYNSKILSLPIDLGTLMPVRALKPDNTFAL